MNHRTRPRLDSEQDPDVLQEATRAPLERNLSSAIPRARRSREHPPICCPRSSFSASWRRRTDRSAAFSIGVQTRFSPSPLRSCLSPAGRYRIQSPRLTPHRPRAPRFCPAARASPSRFGGDLRESPACVHKPLAFSPTLGYCAWQQTTRLPPVVFVPCWGRTGRRARARRGPSNCGIDA